MAKRRDLIGYSVERLIDSEIYKSLFPTSINYTQQEHNRVLFYMPNWLQGPGDENGM